MSMLHKLKAIYLKYWHTLRICVNASHWYLIDKPHNYMLIQILDKEGEVCSIK